VTQTLGFVQIGLAASQLPLRLSCNGNIGHRPEKLDVTRRISCGTSHGVDVFDRVVRHQQSIFVVKILSIEGSMLKGLLHGDAIFRMGALDNRFQGRFRCQILLEDPEGFL
jgi:hypothetical protein